MTTCEEKIDARILKDVSKVLYKNCYRRHMTGVDMCDIEAVRNHIKDKSPSLRLMCLKVAHHISADDNYMQHIVDENEKYKSELMNRTHNPIDWPTIIKEKYHKRNDSQYHFIAFLLSVALSVHPRRFQDYFLLDRKDTPDTNFYDGERIHFRVYKTANSLTGGDRVVTLDRKVRDWFEVYIKRFSIEGRLFDMTQRKFRYIFEKYDIPRATASRRYGERMDIENGMSHLAASKKYNHSISTQVVSYLKRPKDSGFSNSS